jgi:hypothetical protein
LACRRHRRLIEAVRGARAALAPMLTESARRHRQRTRLGHGASSSRLLRDAGSFGDRSFGDRRVPRAASTRSSSSLQQQRELKSPNASNINVGVEAAELVDHGQLLLVLAHVQAHEGGLDGPGADVRRRVRGA